MGNTRFGAENTDHLHADRDIQPGYIAERQLNEEYILYAYAFAVALGPDLNRVRPSGVTVGIVTNLLVTSGFAYSPGL